MKYTRLDTEVEGTDILNQLFVDMIEEDSLNCQLQVSQSDSSLCTENESSDGSAVSLCNKGDHSVEENCDKIEDVSTNSTHISDQTSESEELPCRLVITYHFSFDIEEDGYAKGVNSVHSEDRQFHVDNVSKGTCEEDIFNNREDNMFEDSSFCCEDEGMVLEYSSVKNGSKNNLLDESFEPEIKDGLEHAGLVDYDSDPSSNTDSDSSTIQADSSNSEEITGLDTNVTALESKMVSKFCGNPAMPSMRNGYIYYSSEVRLYKGVLRYDDTCSERKFKLARKLLKKMFPSKKYVVNA